MTKPKPGDYAKAVATNVKALVAARFITEADGQSLPLWLKRG